MRKSSRTLAGTLKEQFRHFWERANARTALDFFEVWYARAVRCRLKPVIAAAKMLKRHLLNLLNYHHYRLTNATAEGLNSRIQEIKADARGFRSFQNFRTRIYLHKGTKGATASQTNKKNSPTPNKIIIAGTAATANLTIKPTMLKNGMSTSTTVTFAGRSSFTTFAAARWIA